MPALSKHTLRCLPLLSHRHVALPTMPCRAVPCQIDVTQIILAEREVLRLQRQQQALLAEILPQQVNLRFR